MRARIYRQPKTAMQSGQANTGEWVLEWGQSAPRHLDPLMGWTGSTDTRSQVRLFFVEQAQAIAYAEREGLAYDLERPTPKRFVPKVYSDNFAPGRRQNWTH
ncbi:hypothetical protein FHR90_002019 [Endobacter medicaginis]|jgi:ETC complex I subunit conserved region|uniref:ETC complex I subunit n=1 Tax=Endobacter medicaginis TaxID=1181271 RepID=A0A839V0J3_9PROT|nr:ETC complex I subunit [Endobacter medicaginis]MBB3174183.1 hypothetical protein [Endobacter medicaginis]MCX5474228.1 ETC complex I subunit [Endobacter medicaginis]NVN29991.1 ETC complex I subunit [Endobacter medicaginis]